MPAKAYGRSTVNSYKNGRTLKNILNACGKYNTLCPYCFNIDTGEGREDHPDHAVQDCTHKSAKVARDSLEAKTRERQWREGPFGVQKHIYTQSDGTITWEIEPNTTTSDILNSTQETTNMEVDKIVRINHEDALTGTQTTLHIYKHQFENLSKIIKENTQHQR